MEVDCAIIGGGIVGLSVALHLGRQQPGLRLVVLEKESQVATKPAGTVELSTRASITSPAVLKLATPRKAIVP